MLRPIQAPTAGAMLVGLFPQRGAPITCTSALWLTLIGLSRSQNIHVDWSGGTPHLPHLEEGHADDEDEPVDMPTVRASADAHGASYTPPSPPAGPPSHPPWWPPRPSTPPPPPGTFVTVLKSRKLG